MNSMHEQSGEYSRQEPSRQSEPHQEGTLRQPSREDQERLGREVPGREEQESRIFRGLHPFYKGNGWSKNQ